MWMNVYVCECSVIITPWTIRNQVLIYLSFFFLDMNHAFQLAARAVFLSNSADIEKFSFELPYVKPNVSTNTTGEDNSTIGMYKIMQNLWLATIATFHKQIQSKNQKTCEDRCARLCISIPLVLHREFLCGNQRLAIDDIIVTYDIIMIDIIPMLVNSQA